MTNCEHLIENALVAIRCGDDDFKELFDKKGATRKSDNAIRSEYNN